MRNPWLDIPLVDYEAHMSLSSVAQAQALSDIFAGVLKTYCPRSIAILGCAGGNGFERISAKTTQRVVGVDINPNYLQHLRVRFEQHIPQLELVAGDVQTQRYEWKCNALNAPSRAAAQRLGFSFEGIFRQAAVVKGRNRDTAWYSVIDSEWPLLSEAFQRWLVHSNFDENGQHRKRLSDLTGPLLKNRR